MLIAVETIIQAIVFVLQVVPVGSNIGLLRVLWAMSNGSFLKSHGALHGALAVSGFSAEEIRQSWAAMSYGAWSIDDLTHDVVPGGGSTQRVAGTAVWGLSG
jgi:hypothetical protein